MAIYWDQFRVLLVATKLHGNNQSTVDDKLYCKVTAVYFLINRCSHWPSFVHICVRFHLLMLCDFLEFVCWDKQWVAQLFEWNTFLPQQKMKAQEGSSGHVVPFHCCSGINVVFFCSLILKRLPSAHQSTHTPKCAFPSAAAAISLVCLPCSRTDDLQPRLRLVFFKASSLFFPLSVPAASFCANSSTSINCGNSKFQGFSNSCFHALIQMWMGRELEWKPSSSNAGAPNGCSVDEWRSLSQKPRSATKSASSARAHKRNQENNPTLELRN